MNEQRPQCRVCKPGYERQHPRPERQVRKPDALDRRRRMDIERAAGPVAERVIAARDQPVARHHAPRNHDLRQRGQRGFDAPAQRIERVHAGRVAGAGHIRAPFDVRHVVRAGVERRFHRVAPGRVEYVQLCRHEVRNARLSGERPLHRVGERLARVQERAGQAPARGVRVVHEYDRERRIRGAGERGGVDRHRGARVILERAA